MSFGSVAQLTSNSWAERTAAAVLNSKQQKGFFMHELRRTSEESVCPEVFSHVAYSGRQVPSFAPSLPEMLSLVWLRAGGRTHDVKTAGCEFPSYLCCSHTGVSRGLCTGVLSALMTVQACTGHLPSHAHLCRVMSTKV